MVTDAHWLKIQKALTRLAMRDGTGGQELLDYFRTEDTMLYDETLLDTFLTEQDTLELDALKAQRDALNAEIAAREA